MPCLGVARHARYHQGMHAGIFAALEPHRAWLAGLRWLGRFEPAGLAVAMAGALIAAASGTAYLGLVAGMALLAGHLLATAAILLAAARPYSPALLMLVGLSGLHAWLWLLQGLLQGRSVALACLGVGAGFAAGAGAVAWRNEARWRALAQARDRDSFHWLLTRAPFILRWRMARWLASTGEGARNGQPSN